MGTGTQTLHPWLALIVVLWSIIGTVVIYKTVEKATGRWEFSILVMAVVVWLPLILVFAWLSRKAEA